jgi:hypothetical protein
MVTAGGRGGGGSGGGRSSACCSTCTYVVISPVVDLQAVAEGRARLYDNASQNCRSVHAIKVVSLQDARPGQASGERGELDV